MRALFKIPHAPPPKLDAEGDWSFELEGWLDLCTRKVPTLAPPASCPDPPALVHGIVPAGVG